MTFLEIIKLIWKLLPYLIAAIGTLSALFYRSRAKKYKIESDEWETEYNSLKENYDSTITTEKKKTEIREKHNEKENDIMDNPGSDHGVMPVKTIGTHNHDFCDPCGTDCPAHSGKG